MVQETILAEIPSASALVEWFGYWPSFHDAEVLSILLKREGESCVKVHTFQMTNDLNASGHYGCIKHVTVNFLLEGGQRSAARRIQRSKRDLQPWSGETRRRI